MSWFTTVVDHAAVFVTLLSSLWWTWKLSRVRRLARQRARVPRERQVAELRAELAGVVSTRGGRLLSVPQAKYPGLTTEQARRVVETQWPGEYLELREQGPKGAPTWLFHEHATPPKPEPPAKRMSQAVRLVAVPYNLLFLGALWYGYPRTDWLGVTELYLVYGLGFFLLMLRDLRRSGALVVLFVHLLVGIPGVLAVVHWAEQHSRGEGLDSVGLLLSALFGLPFVLLPAGMYRGTTDESAPREGH
ncbi:hypothetical protein ACIRYZ_44780 [Kitasatospora sp. NPDC101155]|uniref:hypothetical protein n=1 Tax=Kitasatospora sp. NPDC101155 TaxID=3364097 RepID=UPI0037FC3B30